MSVTDRITAEWGSFLDLRNVEKIDLASVRSTLSALEPPPALLMRSEQFDKHSKVFDPPSKHPPHKDDPDRYIPALLIRGHQEEKERAEMEKAEASATAEMLTVAKAQARESKAAFIEEMKAAATKMAESDADEALEFSRATLGVDDWTKVEAPDLNEPIEAAKLEYEEKSRHVGWYRGAPVYLDEG